MKTFFYCLAFGVLPVMAWSQGDQKRETQRTAQPAAVQTAPFAPQRPAGGVIGQPAPVQRPVNQPITSTPHSSETAQRPSSGSKPAVRQVHKIDMHNVRRVPVDASGKQALKER